MTVEGAYCSGSCTVTDRVAATSTVDPGTEISRITTRVLDSPNSGNFSTRRWNFVAICSGVVCGGASKIDNSGTVVDYVRTSSSRSGARLTIGVGLSQSTIANTVRNVGKTADCLGQTGSDHRCKYIY